jgi:SGNH hydrolase-like domain, acetyltransferase AlgX
MLLFKKPTVPECLPMRLAVAMAMMISACEKGSTEGTITRAVSPAWKPGDALPVIAQLVHRSVPPDPRKADYADCLIVCEFRLLENETAQRLPQHILVALPGFLKREMQPAAAFDAGRVYRLDLITAEDSIRSLKLLYHADDIENLELPLHYATTAAPEDRQAGDFPAERPAGYFVASSGDNEPGADGAATKRVKYPWSEKAAKERTKVIAEDMAAIRADLLRNGGDWAAWHERLAPFHEDLVRKTEKADGLLRTDKHVFQFLPADRYRHLVKKTDDGPIRMLDSLNRQLRERGIDLIVVPFPSKETVHADKFSGDAPEDGIFAPWRRRFLLELLERDIEVINLVPAFQENKEGHEYIYYDALDKHPADGGIRIAAEKIARRLARYELDKRPEHPALKFKTEEVEFAFTGDGLLRGGFLPGSRYKATRVLFEDGGEIVVGETSPCPVIVMGDSFTVVPDPNVTSASLPAHLALHLGEVPCQLTSMGSSDKAMRMLAREGGKFFANRCSLVFVFSPSRLFGSVSKGGSGSWDLHNLAPLRFE